MFLVLLLLARDAFAFYGIVCTAFDNEVLTYGFPRFALKFFEFKVEFALWYFDGLPEK